MKKLFLFLIMLSGLMIFCGNIFADCTIGLAWTPDPAQSAITEQEVWYNPDGIVNNGDEAMKGSALAADVNQFEFTETGDCLSGHKIYVLTKYLTGTEVKSNEIIPQDVVGAIISISVQHQQ